MYIPGGVMTLGDLDAFEVQWRDPEVSYLHNGGYTVYGVPLPISGLGQGFFLRMMDRMYLKLSGTILVEYTC